MGESSPRSLDSHHSATFLKLRSYFNPPLGGRHFKLGDSCLISKLICEDIETTPSQCNTVSHNRLTEAETSQRQRRQPAERLERVKALRSNTSYKERRHRKVEIMYLETNPVDSLSRRKWRSSLWWTQIQPSVETFLLCSISNICIYIYIIIIK